MEGMEITLSKNGASMYFSLENNKIPVLTTKKNGD